MHFAGKVVFMKLLSGIMLGAAVFLLVSCGTVNTARKYPHMAADLDPFSAGTIETQLERTSPSYFNKIPVEVIFYPRLNAVALEYIYESITYRQFWDLEGRQQFTRALENYKADFAARNLIDKYRRTRSVYGKAKVRTEWEISQFAITRYAYSNAELGYRFKMESPFFVTLTRSAKEDKSAGNSSTRSESPQFSLYFTRGQADDLAKLFDQAYLMELAEKVVPVSNERKKWFDFSIFQRKDKREHNANNPTGF